MRTIRLSVIVMFIALSTLSAVDAPVFAVAGTVQEEHTPPGWATARAAKRLGLIARANVGLRVARAKHHRTAIRDFTAARTAARHWELQDAQWWLGQGWAHMRIR